MKQFKLNIGGGVNPGDVVGVAYNNCIVFGWFVQQGQYGSLQYIPLRSPENVKDYYDQYLNGTLNNKWWEKKFAKGFLFKHVQKDFITSWSAFNNRAIKISHPEEFFKDSEQEKQYLKSREILRNLKFPAK